MQDITRICNVETRAERLNLSLHKLCVLADVRPDNVTRWRKREIANPTMRTFERDMETLERTLYELETELARYLHDLDPVRPGYHVLEGAA